MISWNFGDVVVLRGVWNGKLWWACPAFMVQDTPQLIAFYWPVGTPTRSPSKRPTVEDEFNNRVDLVKRNWIDHDVLSLNIPGTAYSVEVMWQANSHELRCWYVNLQEPLRRTKLGFDTMDQMLDIVISPDRSSWRWKDEDEFSQAVSMGVYSPQKAGAIREQGEEVIKLLEANASPFREGWETWMPPLEWGIPDFPAGWEDQPL